MKNTYYLFNDGRMSRRDNTLCFVARDKEGHEQSPKYIPIETIETYMSLVHWMSMPHCSITLDNSTSGCISLIIMSIIQDPSCQKTTSWQVKCK